MRFFIIASFVALIFFRFVIPVEPTPLDAHTWYDKLSHIWVGLMIAIALTRGNQYHTRTVAGLLLIVASLIEFIFFKLA